MTIRNGGKKAMINDVSPELYAPLSYVVLVSIVIYVIIQSTIDCCLMGYTKDLGEAAACKNVPWFDSNTRPTTP